MLADVLLRVGGRKRPRGHGVKLCQLESWPPRSAASLASGQQRGLWSVAGSGPGRCPEKSSAFFAKEAQRIGDRLPTALLALVCRLWAAVCAGKWRPLLPRDALSDLLMHVCVGVRHFIPRVAALGGMMREFGLALQVQFNATVWRCVASWGIPGVETFGVEQEVGGRRRGVPEERLAVVQESERRIGRRFPTADPLRCLVPPGMCGPRSSFGRRERRGSGPTAPAFRRRLRPCVAACACLAHGVRQGSGPRRGHRCPRQSPLGGCGDGAVVKDAHSRSRGACCCVGSMTGCIGCSASLSCTGVQVSPV